MSDDAIDRERLQSERERHEAALRDKQRGISPFQAAVAAGLVGLLGTLLGGILNIQVETKKQEGTLILEAIKTGDHRLAARNLIFFADAGLIELTSDQLNTLREQADTVMSPVLPRPASAVDGDTTILPAGKYRVPAETRTVQGIVLHATESPADIDALVQFFQSGELAASAHYLIGRSGDIVQLVSESYIAFHTGRASDPRFSNPNSIGIDLIHQTGASYPDEQITALVTLLKDIMRRYDLTTEDIATHAAIAVPSGSKRDAGDLDMAAIRARLR